MSAKDRFWAKVRWSPQGCWVWTASRTIDGYGWASRDGKSTHAHRVSWVMDRGRPVPEGMVVHHECESKLCVRPDHLRAMPLREHGRLHIAAKMAKKAAA